MSIKQYVFEAAFQGAIIGAILGAVTALSVVVWLRRKQVDVSSR